MKTLFTRPLAYGLVAFGLLAGTAAPSQAGPLPQPQLQLPVTTSAVTPVRDSWAGGGPRSEEWRWRNRGDRGWRHNRQWRGDWGGRRWHNDGWRGDGWRHRRHYRDSYIGLGGFGLGLGLGLAAPRYYDEYYVPPRRTYRTYRGLSSAHVRWCSARYRTYRAWDNTYVPSVGYRAICRSPYG